MIYSPNRGRKQPLPTGIITGRNGKKRGNRWIFRRNCVTLQPQNPLLHDNTLSLPALLFSDLISEHCLPARQPDRPHPEPGRLPAGYPPRQRPAPAGTACRPAAAAFHTGVCPLCPAAGTGPRQVRTAARTLRLAARRSPGLLRQPQPRTGHRPALQGPPRGGNGLSRTGHSPSAGGAGDTAALPGSRRDTPPYAQFAGQPLLREQPLRGCPEDAPRPVAPLPHRQGQGHRPERPFGLSGGPGERRLGRRHSATRAPLRTGQRRFGRDCHVGIQPEPAVLFE